MRQRSLHRAARRQAQPSTAEAPAVAPALDAGQGLLGNAELGADHPLAALARGGQLLAAAGIQAPTLVPGQVPLSVMREVMRMGAAADEGLNTEAAGEALRRSSGHPLPEAVRARMESAFGHDFSHVRIHTDAAAGDAAMELNALAFALGAEVFFAPNQWHPGTDGGDELLAHELTHVVQHDEARLPRAQGPLDVSSPSDPHEREAEAMAAEVVALSTSELGGEVGEQRPGSDGQVSELQAGMDRPSQAFISKKAEPSSAPSLNQSGVSTKSSATANASGVKATASLTAKAGVGVEQSFQLPDLDFGLGGERFTLNLGLKVSCFAGLSVDVKGTICARWKKEGPGPGIPKVDKIFQWIKELFEAKEEDGVVGDPSSLTKQQAQAIVDDKLAAETQRQFDANVNALNKEENELKYMERRRDELSKKGDYTGAKVWSDAADQKHKKVGDARQQLANSPSPTPHGQGLAPSNKKTAMVSHEGKDPVAAVEHRRSLEEDRGISAGISAEAFAGIKASAELYAKLYWHRKESAKYDLKGRLESIYDSLQPAFSPTVQLGLDVAILLAGQSGAMELLGHCLAFVFEFGGDTTELAGASIMVEGRAGASANLNLQVGFSGGRLRFVASAGASFGLGAGFQTDWSVHLLDGARLALVLITSPELQALLVKAIEVGAEMGESIADAFEGLTDWLLFADNKAREIVRIKGHEVLPPSGRGALLQNLLTGALSVVSDGDEQAATSILEYSATAGDMDAVLEVADAETIRNAVMEFEVADCRKRSLVALGLEDHNAANDS